jgi:predicted metal-dependent phosphoesterase TrpH
LITFAVGVSAAFSLSPLVDVLQPHAPAAASLKTPFLYDILAPASNILDTLTLLSPPQYWATFALCVVVFFAPGIVRDLRRPRRFSSLSTIASLLRFVGGTVAVVGIMIVVWRPMAALSLHDPDLIAVDFHSHTSASHDGRSDFGAERNREWHQSSGFNVAYITDHRTFDGALDAAERNPRAAGDGVTLLPGVELRDGDEHPILLGVNPSRTRLTSADLEGAKVATDGGLVPPILLLTIPGNIVRVPPNEYTGPIRLAGIEVSDGGPRGMAQTAKYKEEILALADKLHLAPVAGSDNHGWGRTAPAWSVLRIPGWRRMTPASLDVAIRRTILARAPGTTEVIARRTVGPPSGRAEAALGGVAVGALMLRTMNLRDRLSWILWSWLAALLSLVRARRNRRQLRVRIRETMRRRVPRPLIDAAAVRVAS